MEDSLQKRIYSSLRKELLICLRGCHSSLELSKKLGYSFNKVRRWESEEKVLRWDEFVDYCDLLEVPLVQTLVYMSLVANDISEFELKNKFFLILKTRLAPLLTQKDLAEHFNCSHSVLKRYLKGNTIPDVDFIFSCFDLQKNILGNFVMNLLGSKITPKIKEILGESARLALAAPESNPLSIAVEACLGLNKYIDMKAHDDQFIAEKVGCSVGEVQKMLEDSLQKGTIQKNDQGKFELNYTTINTSGLDRPRLIELMKFWMQRSINKMQPTVRTSCPSGINGVLNFRVAPVSKAAIHKINDIIARSSSEILQVLEKDTEPLEEVRVILMNNFNSNHLPQFEKKETDTKISHQSPILYPPSPEL